MTTWIETTKNTDTYTASSSNTSTFTSQDKASPLTNAGDLMGLLLALTYSGGQALPGVTNWSTVSKS